MRWMLLMVFVGGCAAPATQIEPCPSCEAEARAAKQAREAEARAAKQAEVREQAEKEQRAEQRLRTPGLLNRASFDLNCPGQEIVVVKLSAGARGVRGCGKQAAYLARNGMMDDWVLDSSVH